MNQNLATYQRFSEAEIKAFEPAMKIGLLATVNDEGLPHVTMMSSIKAGGEQQVVFGQFMEGRSKGFLHRNPKAGWLIMNLDKEVWRGKASFTHTEKSGKDFDFYNNQPLFRYNAYFGVHTVYYLDLKSHSGKAPLPMNRVVAGAIKTVVAKTLRGDKAENTALNGWTMNFFNKLDTLKFLSYIDEDGYPVIVPAIQAQAADPEHILYSASVYSDELKAIRPGTPLAVFGLALTMEDVLMRGEYQGLKRTGGLLCGSVKVDWVYNPMPPAPAQIYPPVPLQPVTDF